MNIASIVLMDLRNIPEVNQIVRWTTAGSDLKDGNGDLYLCYGSLLAIDKVTTDNTIKGNL